MGATASTGAVSVVHQADHAEQGSSRAGAAGATRPQRLTQPGAGFRGCHLRGVQPRPDLLAKEADILASLRKLGSITQFPGENAHDAALRELPKLLAKACKMHTVTLLDLQALILPPWGLGWGMAFASKAELFDFVGREQSSARIGELMDLDLPGSCLNIPDDEMTVRTGRWAELVDGVAVVRLMSDRSPAATRSWASTRVINLALESLRMVSWSPDIHWAFPCEYRRRVYFLCCVGERLNLGPVWVKAVLPFVASSAADEMEAATWGRRRPGQVLDYYSKTHARWMPCRVTATDPVEECIMIDIKPNYWLTVEEQAHVLRPLQPKPKVATAIKDPMSPGGSRTGGA
mmetsp:Transcript_6135/g.19291  ORF Transcript_6135/g.19291 Transcript_6135/m.19291 type:complete len:347 (-) Transcript_6135:67-1107(-)